MFCPSCGNQNPNDARFCMQCGYKYEQMTYPAASTAPQTKSSQPTQKVHPHPTQKIIIHQKKSSLPQVLLLFLILGGIGVVFLGVAGYTLERQGDWLGFEKSIFDVKADDKELSGRINLPKVKKNQITSGTSSSRTSSTESNYQSETNIPEQPEDAKSYCYLYNSSGFVNVRSDCDTLSCDDDQSTLIAQYPNGTKVIGVEGGSVVSSKGYTWIQVVPEETDTIVWVASSKVRCK